MPGRHHCGRRRWGPPIRGEYRIALVGNPNVGKSVIFNSWTGLGAIVSNYPGTTVELMEGTVFLPYHEIYPAPWESRNKHRVLPPPKPEEVGKTVSKREGPIGEAEEAAEAGEAGIGGWLGRRLGRGRRRGRRGAGWTGFEGIRLRVVDLPGSYTIISPTSMDERVTQRYLQWERPDVVVNVIDATNLQRNLYLTLALLEFDIPLVVCLNQVDLARRMGLEIDAKKLERMLGVPVVATVAVEGRNLKELLRVAARAALGHYRGRRKRRMLFPNGIEERLVDLGRRLVEMGVCPPALPTRIFVQQLLEGDEESLSFVKGRPRGGEALRLVDEVRRQLEQDFGSDVVLVLAEKRRDYARYIEERVQRGKAERLQLRERISAVLTHRVWGLPIAIFLLVGSLLLLFGVGYLFDETVGTFWEEVINPAFEAAFSVVPWPLVRAALYYGIALGLQGWLFIAVPYVATFYLLLAIYEDTGYMARVAFLMDGIMHRVGLHGRAIIPMLLGLGCNVPAVLGGRILTTKKERAIVGLLIVLVPCSAQLAVILGTVALYGSILYAFIILGIVVGLILVLGSFLRRTLPGESMGLVMEVPPLRLPSLQAVLKKTWVRFKEFLYIALPLIVVGSAVLGVLKEAGFLEMAVAPLSPLVAGWLGLPPITGAALLYGILRKELTVELLVVLNRGMGIETLMTVRQMFVFAMVTTLYVPCVATIVVLAREYGWKYTVTLTLGTMVMALLLGGLANILLVALGLP